MGFVLLHFASFLALIIPVTSADTSKGKLISFCIWEDMIITHRIQTDWSTVHNLYRFFILNTGQPAARDTGILYANFKTHSKSYLNITSVGTELVKDITDCGFACVAKDSCFSFNLARNKALPRLCELLPSNLYIRADKVVTSQSYDHFSIPVRFYTFKPGG